LISADGDTAAIRGPDGRLALLHNGRDTFAVKEWLAADADGRPPKDASLATGTRCDATGCVGVLADGRLISMVLAIEGFEEDCTRAALVVSPRQAQMPCRATLIDRPVWQARGALALRRSGEGFDLIASRPAGTDRPWAPAPLKTKTAPLDATPRLQDIAPGDQ